MNYRVAFTRVDADGDSDRVLGVRSPEVTDGALGDAVEAL
jgi:hypothetical protein